MTTVVSMDGPLKLEPSPGLLDDIEQPLSVWHAYGRHPYRSLGGHHRFMITRDDFRFVDGSRFWRFDESQTEVLLHTSFPDDAVHVMRRLEAYRNP
ncbi:hypothetical protein QE430_003302 [Microbacterium testaceum]|uniref:hypothetical protein n=1 Tax=Microbacterium testaceum TaxID=2033 RepID=UPI00278B532F|nr:hypothetical protein [Microbacterium testaceum]MDQ1174995.1 hypothetical protein [Microbacterium testaceum]